jgi:succinate dehydrogenase hydrophobic anchor subunit
LKFLSVLSHGKKGIKYIVENHKKELVIAILVLMFFVAVAAAAVYNSMFMQIEIGVTPA